MRKKVSGSIIVTLVVALLAILRTLGRDERVHEYDDEEDTEKRGLKWGPIMPWWPRR